MPTDYRLVWLGYAGLAGLMLAYFILARPGASTIVALTGVVALLPVLFSKLEYGLLALLVLRPLIDAFTSYTVISIRSISLNMNAVLAILVCGWGLLMLIKHHVPVRSMPGANWLLAFLGVATLSLLVSLDWFTSITELLRLSSIVVMYLLAAHLARNDSHYIVHVIHAVMLGAIVPIALALYQLVTLSGWNIDGISNRIYGTFGHPNVLGFYMVLLLGLLIMKYFFTPSAHRSLVYPWFMVAGGIALLFTYTRGAWLGLLVYGLVLGVVQYRTALFTTVVTMGAVVVLVVLGNGFIVNVFNVNIYDIPVVQRLVSSNEETGSINWRVRVFETMLPKVFARPVLGYGFGNFVTLRQQGDLGLFDDPEAHNDYLRIAIETGLLGLAVYIGLIVSFLRQAIHNYLVWPKGSWQKQYSLGAIALVISIYTMSTGDNLLQGTAVMWAFMASLAGLLSLRG